jgi:hypothetical protein
VERTAQRRGRNPLPEPLGKNDRELVISGVFVSTLRAVAEMGLERRSEGRGERTSPAIEHVCASVVAVHGHHLE